MTVSDPIDYTAAAQLADVAHAELVKALMAAIDLVDHIQRGTASPDVAALRLATGKIIRRSTITHSMALGALTVDTSPAYSEELLSRADEFEQEGGE